VLLSLFTILVTETPFCIPYYELKNPKARALLDFPDFVEIPLIK